MRTVRITRDLRQLGVHEVMSRNIVTIPQEAHVGDLVELLLEQGILGVPVVDSIGLLAGVVSMYDITRAEGGILNATSDPYYRDYLVLEGQVKLPAVDTSLARLKVSDIMSRRVITASPTATMQEVAVSMLEHNIHRIIVAEQGRILGVVTATDLLRALADRLPEMHVSSARKASGEAQ